jgi:hypothetical protein
MGQGDPIALSHSSNTADLKNMSKKLLYRLGEYRITDYENSRLTWERHSDFGAQRTGNGYLLGDILLLGPGNCEEDGFLIGEFLDQLKKLPLWDKTSYYVHTHEAWEVATGRGLTEGFLNRILPSAQRIPAGSKPGRFRLGRYQVTINAGGNVVWQTYAGRNRVVGGPGRIGSGLLVLGSQEMVEEGRTKREFLEMLAQLPQWEETRAWCHGSRLRDCRTLRQPVRFKGHWKPRDNRAERTREKKPLTAQLKNRSERSAKRLFPLNLKLISPSVPRLTWPFGFAWRKGVWPKSPGTRFWLTGLLLLAISGLVLVVALTFHSLEKTWSGSHGYKKQHH